MRARAPLTQPDLLPGGGRPSLIRDGEMVHRGSLLLLLRVTTALGLSSVVTLGAFSCQSIAGIEQRSLGPCGEYCDTIMDVCQGEQAAYANYETCMGVCEHLPPGDSLEPYGTDGVACRLAEARQAKLSEKAYHCMNAGPGGGPECGEGNVCANYCQLYQSICGDVLDVHGSLDACTRNCTVLRDRHAFDIQADYDGDTLQCRIVHVSSATVDPTKHCAHSVLAPPTPPCVDEPDGIPECSRYCSMIGVACQGENAQYESEAQCLAACQALDPGHNSDSDADTVGCRIYHSYNSLNGPATHCAHAGPSGDGHCGEVTSDQNAICRTYCRIVELGCSEQYAAAFTERSCEQQCSELSDSARDSHYSVVRGQAGGNHLSCRLLHAVRAIAGDPASCNSALGGAECS